MRVTWMPWRVTEHWIQGFYRTIIPSSLSRFKPADTGFLQVSLIVKFPFNLHLMVDAKTRPPLVLRVICPSNYYGGTPSTIGYCYGIEEGVVPKINTLTDLIDDDTLRCILTALYWERSDHRQGYTEYDWRLRVVKNGWNLLHGRFISVYQNVSVFFHGWQKESQNIPLSAGWRFWHHFIDHSGELGLILEFISSVMDVQQLIGFTLTRRVICVTNAIWKACA